MCRRLIALAFAALLASACDSPNPVAPTDNTGGGNGGGSGSGEALVVSVQSDRSQLSSGSTEAATLTVSVKKGDGAAAADGTEVAINTNLGNFGSDGAGQPIQLVKKTLAGGVATVPFFAGTATGTANILAQVGTSVGRINLPIVTPAAVPVADFAFEVSALSVLFEDLSTGEPTEWQWEFGDGDTSNRQNPLHEYPEAGTYTVTLRITAAGGSASKRKFVTVEAGEPLIADFGFTVNGLNVLFAESSAGDPVSFSWDFGDGKTSNARNPSHNYTSAGTYTVSLTVENEFGVSDSTSQFVTVSQGEAPKADFELQTNNLKVFFNDTSTGNPTGWSWDFGDCPPPPPPSTHTCTSTARNPSHEYLQAGTYTVTLTASNAGGSNAKTKLVTVSLGAAPKASFEFQTAGLKAVFNDTSTGNPTSWSWDFGECTGSPQCFSSAQNPTYTYQNPGTYTVTLTATNAAGSSSVSKLVQVTSASKPSANFCYQRNKKAVIFFDASTQSPTSWSWNFGDGGVSALQNPSHTYGADGTYGVTLTATNSAGQSSTSRFVTVSDSTVDAGPICN
ncbi:MAG TPA: PKD domain-containing protein [Thermoanaerobaculia bacterium]